MPEQFSDPGIAIRVRLQAEITPIDPAEDQLFWDVGLNGLEEGLDQDGNRLSFRHRPIRIAGSCSVHGTSGDQLIYSEFGNEGVYAGFSPFTQWTLNFRKFEYLDFSKVAGLKLYLSGYLS